MRISDWSSDVCSSDLELLQSIAAALRPSFAIELVENSDSELRAALSSGRIHMALVPLRDGERGDHVTPLYAEPLAMFIAADHPLAGRIEVGPEELAAETMIARSEEHTSELQSLMRISYSVFCLNKKKP